MSELSFSRVGEEEKVGISGHETREGSKLTRTALSLGTCGIMEDVSKILIAFQVAMISVSANCQSSTALSGPVRQLL